MGQYANQTTVSVEKSRAEVETIIRRFGASGFAYGWEDNRTVIQFTAGDRRIMFTLDLPDRNDEEFTHSRRGGTGPLKPRSKDQAESKWEQGCRQRWRSLVLIIKAKFAAVEDGIVSFEEEFLPYIQLPNGQSVAQAVLPEIEAAYSGKKIKGLLPPPPG